MTKLEEERELKKGIATTVGGRMGELECREFNRLITALVRAVREDCAKVELIACVLEEWLDPEDAADAAHWLVRCMKGEKEALDKMGVAAAIRGKG